MDTVRGYPFYAEEQLFFPHLHFHSSSGRCLNFCLGDWEGGREGRIQSRRARPFDRGFQICLCKLHSSLVHPMSCQLEDTRCTEDKCNLWRQILNPQFKGRALEAGFEGNELVACTAVSSKGQRNNQNLGLLTHSGARLKWGMEERRGMFFLGFLPLSLSPFGIRVAMFSNCLERDSWARGELWKEGGKEGGGKG